MNFPNSSMNSPKPIPPTTAAVRRTRCPRYPSKTSRAATISPPPQSMWAMCRPPPPSRGKPVKPRKKRTASKAATAETRNRSSSSPARRLRMKNGRTGWLSMRFEADRNRKYGDRSEQGRICKIFGDGQGVGPIRRRVAQCQDDGQHVGGEFGDRNEDGSDQQPAAPAGAQRHREQEKEDHGQHAQDLLDQDHPCMRPVEARDLGAA